MLAQRAALSCLFSVSVVRDPSAQRSEAAEAGVEEDRAWAGGRAGPGPPLGYRESIGKLLLPLFYVKGGENLNDDMRTPRKAQAAQEEDEEEDDDDEVRAGCDLESNLRVPGGSACFTMCIPSPEDFSAPGSR